MESHDLMYELAAALDNHKESGGHEFEMTDFDAMSGNGEIRVTAPDGTVSEFHVRLRDVTPVRTTDHRTADQIESSACDG